MELGASLFIIKHIFRGISMVQCMISIELYHVVLNDLKTLVVFTFLYNVFDGPTWSHSG